MHAFLVLTQHAIQLGCHLAMLDDGISGRFMGNCRRRKGNPSWRADGRRRREGAPWMVGDAGGAEGTSTWWCGSMEGMCAGVAAGAGAGGGVVDSTLTASLLMETSKSCCCTAVSRCVSCLLSKNFWNAPLFMRCKTLFTRSWSRSVESMTALVSCGSPAGISYICINDWSRDAQDWKTLGSSA